MTQLISSPLEHLLDHRVDHALDRLSAPPVEPDDDRLQPATVVNRLDRAEMHSWRSLVIGVTKLLARLDEDLRREHQVSFDEFAVLAAVAETANGTTVEALARDHAIHRNRLTPLLSRMQLAGWIRRQGEGPQDPHSRITVTAEGIALLRSAAGRHVTGIREYFLDHVEPREFHEMARVLRRVSAGLEETRR